MKGEETKVLKISTLFGTHFLKKQDLLGQVSRLRKRE
jgi:hypothetical protein